MTLRGKLWQPFERRMLDIRRRVKPEPYDWYRFDSFANLTPLDALLPGGTESALELAGGEPVADMGAADGDLAFLFESLGCEVTAFDWPGTNANRMLGIKLLKQELGSSVQIREIEMDSQFRLDGERFGLVLSLGLLYHLKNPFYYLERLSRHVRHCLLSTRILPRGTTGDAIARLAGDREFEDDPTNFWLFSETGVLRLLDRCGWDVVRHSITGDRSDDRLFCHAESRIAKTSPFIRLLDGWHELENGAWRWTMREFAAAIENTAGATRFELRFRHVAPGPIAVQAEVNGEVLAARHYEGPGDRIYSQPVRPAMQRNLIRVRLSGTFEAGGRQLGVIVMLPSDTIVDADCGLRLLP